MRQPFSSRRAATASTLRSDTTSATAAMDSHRSKTSTVRAMSGSPPMSASVLSPASPIRVLAPAATIMAPALGVAGSAVISGGCYYTERNATSKHSILRRGPSRRHVMRRRLQVALGAMAFAAALAACSSPTPTPTPTATPEPTPTPDADPLMGHGRTAWTRNAVLVPSDPSLSDGTASNLQRWNGHVHAALARGTGRLHRRVRRGARGGRGSRRLRRGRADRHRGLAERRALPCCRGHRGADSRRPCGVRESPAAMPLGGG